MNLMFCSDCEFRYSITDEILDAVIDRLIDDPDFQNKCPQCGSIEVNLIEVKGQWLGYI